MLVHGVGVLVKIVDGPRNARQGHHAQGPRLQSEHRTSHPDILHKSDSLLLPFTWSSFVDRHGKLVVDSTSLVLPHTQISFTCLP